MRDLGLNILAAILGSGESTGQVTPNVRDGADEGVRHPTGESLSIGPEGGEGASAGRRRWSVRVVSLWGKPKLALFVRESVEWISDCFRAF